MAETLALQIVGGRQPVDGHLIGRLALLNGALEVALRSGGLVPTVELHDELAREALLELHRVHRAVLESGAHLGDLGVRHVGETLEEEQYQR